MKVVRIQSDNGMYITELKKKGEKSFSTDKSNYTHRTLLPGTKLFLLVKTVNKRWKWG